MLQDGGSLNIRHGSVADTQLLLDLFDEAVAWLVERGQPDQWGERPWSSRERPGHVPPVDLPELYVNLLLTSRRHAGKQLGARLVDVAIDEARAADRDVLRVDCWAGAPTLIAWYQRQGFTPAGTFELNGWKGQIFNMSLT